MAVVRAPSERASGFLAANTARQGALAELLAEWEAEDGPLDRAAVDRIIDVYGW